MCYQLDYVDTWLLQMGFNMVWYRADQTQINICFWKDYNMTISLVKPADTGLFRHWGKIMFHIRLVTTWEWFSIWHGLIVMKKATFYLGTSWWSSSIIFHIIPAIRNFQGTKHRQETNTVAIGKSSTASLMLINTELTSFIIMDLQCTVSGGVGE